MPKPVDSLSSVGNSRSRTIPTARAAPQPRRYALAAALTLASDVATRLLPAWRVAVGLTRGRDGLRAARRAQARREATLDRLVATLGWSRDDLPATDGWAGSPDLLAALARHALAAKPAVVVEFGSGLSTLVLARALQLNGGGRLVSFDHNEGFAEVTRRRLEALGLEAEVRAVELAPAERWGYAGDWYDTPDLPDAIDFLLIDGPPAWFNAGTRGAAAPAVFPHLAPGATILLDDADRDGERANAQRWAAEYPDIAWTMLPAAKGLLRGVRAA